MAKEKYKGAPEIGGQWEYAGRVRTVVDIVPMNHAYGVVYRASGANELRKVWFHTWNQWVRKATPFDGTHSTISHADLVRRAASWLRHSAEQPADYTLRNGATPLSSYRCPVVLTEFCGGPTSEVPDAIGFCHQGLASIVVECKATREDFVSDKNKWFRRNGKFGLGMYRYMLTPAELIRTDELPDGWGLLEADMRHVRVVGYSERHERNVTGEMGMLWSHCRMLEARKGD